MIQKPWPGAQISEFSKCPACKIKTSYKFHDVDLDSTYSYTLTFNINRPLDHYLLLFGLSPFPVIVTTRIITFLVGDPYKPSFATITGKGDNSNYYIIR